MAAIAVWAPDAIRPQNEDVHDVTTSVETEIPETATRVFFLYRLNTAFARGADPTHSSLDSRFDLQVNQALPFMPFGSTARGRCSSACATCSAIPTDAGSIYDELLVVRPPKRVIGGVLVKFWPWPRTDRVEVPFGRWLRTTQSAAFLVLRIWLSKFLNRMSDGLERDRAVSAHDR